MSDRKLQSEQASPTGEGVAPARQAGVSASNAGPGHSLTVAETYEGAVSATETAEQSIPGQTFSGGDR